MKEREVGVSIVDRIARSCRVTLLVSVVLCLGCSLDTPVPAEPQPAEPQPASNDLSRVSYTLSLRRASMTGQDFELYKLLPSGLFAECGIVYRGRPEIQSQTIEQVSPELIEQSKRFAKEIQQKYLETDPLSIDQRGSGNGFADPGIFSLVVADGTMKTEIVTSVDWVEQRRVPLASHMHNFTRVVRGLTPEPLCGNAQFYGIGRREESASGGPVMTFEAS